MIMKLINKIALQVLTFALLLSSGQLIAQDNADDRKVLEDMLYEFAEAYGSLPQTKNVESVLQFFSKDATSNIFVFNISGKSRVQNYKTTVGFEAYMNKKLVAARPMAHIKIGIKNAAHLLGLVRPEHV